MTNAQPEPSMEEILASIRRIISEDEEEGGTIDDATAVSEVQSAPSLVPEQDVESVEIAETDMVGDNLSNQTSSDDDFGMIDAAIAEFETEQAPSQVDEVAAHLVTEDVEMIKQNVAEAFEDEQPLVGVEPAAVASQAFQNLSQSVRISEGPGKTLEDIVSEMLRPMVKEWLDANLPQIVEEKVEEEVQRVARRRS